MRNVKNGSANGGNVVRSGPGKLECYEDSYHFWKGFGVHRYINEIAIIAACCCKHVDPMDCTPTQWNRVCGAAVKVIEKLKLSRHLLTGENRHIFNMVTDMDWADAAKYCAKKAPRGKMYYYLIMFSGYGAKISRERLSIQRIRGKRDPVEEITGNTIFVVEGIATRIQAMVAFPDLLDKRLQKRNRAG